MAHLARFSLVSPSPIPLTSCDLTPNPEFPSIVITSSLVSLSLASLSLPSNLFFLLVSYRLIKCDEIHTKIRIYFPTIFVVRQVKPNQYETYILAWLRLQIIDRSLEF